MRGGRVARFLCIKSSEKLAVPAKLGTLQENEHSKNRSNS